MQCFFLNLPDQKDSVTRKDLEGIKNVLDVIIVNVNKISKHQEEVKKSVEDLKTNVDQRLNELANRIVAAPEVENVSLTMNQVVLFIYIIHYFLS